MATETPFVRGAERLSQRIATIRRNLSLPALTDEIGDLLLRRTMDRFDREVDPDGKSWKPLALSTLERKRRLGFGDKKKLVRTQKMRDSIRKITGRNAGATYANTGAGVRIGISDPKEIDKARAQNLGVPGRIPARRFLGVGRLDVKAVDSFLRRKGREAIERS